MWRYPRGEEDDPYESYSYDIDYGLVAPVIYLEDQEIECEGVVLDVEGEPLLGIFREPFPFGFQLP